MKGTEIEFYVKAKGFDCYCKCIGSARRSNKGYAILTIDRCVSVSKYRYYRADNGVRFILPGEIEAGSELHEVGNAAMFKALGIL